MHRVLRMVYVEKVVAVDAAMYGRSQLQCELSVCASMFSGGDSHCLLYVLTHSIILYELVRLGSTVV